MNRVDLTGRCRRESEREREKKHATSSHLSVCADSSAAIVPMSQLGGVQISVYNQRRLVRTFLQCGRIFLTSSAQEKRLIASPPLPFPPRAHMAHSRCQFKFTFQALWETTESESARRRTITTPRGVTGLVWGETNYSVFCLPNQPL